MSLPFHFKMSLYELINYLLTNDRESEVYSLMFSFYLPFISLLTVGNPLTSYDVTNSPTKYILLICFIPDCLISLLQFLRSQKCITIKHKCTNVFLNNLHLRSFSQFASVCYHGYHFSLLHDVWRHHFVKSIVSWCVLFVRLPILEIRQKTFLKNLSQVFIYCKFK